MVQAQGELIGAREDRLRREQELIAGEQLLGTEEQVSGLGADAQLLPYLQRYDVNLAALPSTAGHHGLYTRGLPSGAGSPQEWAGQVGAQANAWLEQAEAKARAGDWAGAAALRQKAEQYVQTSGPQDVSVSSAWQGAFTLAADPTVQARTTLSSPMAQTVGGLVKQGREFLDPESETSRRFKESLTAGATEQIDLGERRAERAIAQEQRQFQRQSRDFGLARGAGRFAQAERSIAARAGERFATARADVHEQAAAERAVILGDAARAFESFSRQFAADTANLGQSWLQNKGGVREQFQGAVDSLRMSGAKLADSLATKHIALMKESAAAAEASKARQRKLITMAAFAGLGLVGGIVGALGVGAAAAGAAGSAGGAGAAAGAGGGWSLLGSAIEGTMFGASQGAAVSRGEY